MPALPLWLLIPAAAGGLFLASKDREPEPTWQPPGGGVSLTATATLDTKTPGKLREALAKLKRNPDRIRPRKPIRSARRIVRHRKDEARHRERAAKFRRRAAELSAKGPELTGTCVPWVVGAALSPWLLTEARSAGHLLSTAARCQRGRQARFKGHGWRIDMAAPMGSVWSVIAMWKGDGEPTKADRHYATVIANAAGFGGSGAAMHDAAGRPWFRWKRRGGV